MEFSVGFDPIAFMAALFAIWFAYHESRRNNSVLVKIIECNHGKLLRRDENHGRRFKHFTIILRNQGISLHDPRLVLKQARFEPRAS
jgi:hypothetical protein